VVKKKKKSKKRGGEKTLGPGDKRTKRDVTCREEIARFRSQDKHKPLTIRGKTENASKNGIDRKGESQATTRRPRPLGKKGKVPRSEGRKKNKMEKGMNRATHLWIGERTRNLWERGNLSLPSEIGFFCLAHDQRKEGLSRRKKYSSRETCHHRPPRKKGRNGIQMSTFSS